MKLFLILTAILASSKAALANPACMVCTVAIGASLEIARALGISDEIVGLWAGAMFALLGYWLILWFDKKIGTLRQGYNFNAAVIKFYRIYLYGRAELFA